MTELVNEKRATNFEYNMKDSVKIGVLVDMHLPKPQTFDVRQDTLDGLRMGFDENLANGVLRRPIEMMYREVEGLPRGTAKGIKDVLQEMVDAGCVMIFGPSTSESSYPVKEFCEDNKIPALTWAGTDDFLGEWTFNLSCGSLPDEPIQIANIIGNHGHRRIAVVYEQYKVGHEDLEYFRMGCGYAGVEIVREVPYFPGSSNDEVIKQLREPGPDAIVSLVRQLVGRTGEDSLLFNDALERAGWTDIPKYCISNWTNGWLDDLTFERYRGWIGLEQLDEGNLLGQAVMDRFHKRFGRRPDYIIPLYCWDVANVLSRAVGGAYPLTSTGVKNAMEKIKLMPAASGSPGTTISFGKWTRRGWMGPGYMVARTATPKGSNRTTEFAGRYEPWQPR